MSAEIAEWTPSDHVHFNRGAKRQFWELCLETYIKMRGHSARSCLHLAESGQNKIDVTPHGWSVHSPWVQQGVEGEDTQAKPWRHEVTPARPINSCKKSLLFSPSKPSNNNITSFACHCSCSYWLPYIYWRCYEPILMYTLNLYMLFIIFRETCLRSGCCWKWWFLDVCR